MNVWNKYGCTLESTINTSPICHKQTSNNGVIHSVMKCSSSTNNRISILMYSFELFNKCRSKICHKWLMCRYRETLIDN